MFSTRHPRLQTILPWFRGGSAPRLTRPDADRDAGPVRERRGGTPRRSSRWDGVRSVANLLNLSTPLGLAAALLGGARLRRGPRGLILAEGYRFGFPIAGAFTVGDVIVTASDFDRLGAAQPDLLDHERRHSCQYAVLGPWFLPAYGVASAWSWWRAGDPATRNAFERHAGLVSGGYLPQ